MTPCTSERERLRKKVTDDSDPPPWRDVISLEVALRGDDSELQDGLWKLVEEVDNTGVLIRRVAERWAENWKIYDHRLSRAIERYSNLHEVNTLLAKVRVLEQGLHDALQEAEDRGVSEIIEDGAAETTWWLSDLSQQDLEIAAATVQKGLENEIIDEAGLPKYLDDFEAAERELEAIATGEDPQDSTVPATELRAFLFASWLRARAIQRAEVQLLGITYSYSDDFGASEMLHVEPH